MSRVNVYRMYIESSLLNERTIKIISFNLKYWKLIIKMNMWQCDIQMIYIKNICRLNERLILEKQIRNEQHFYKLERCFVNTLSINFRLFVSISVLTYNFYSWVILLRLFEHIFRDVFIMIEYDFRDIFISCFK